MMRRRTRRRTLTGWSRSCECVVGFLRSPADCVCGRLAPAIEKESAEGEVGLEQPLKELSVGA